MRYSDTYLHDLTDARSVVPVLESLHDCSILITGAGGLICSALVDFLLQLNITQEARLQVFAGMRSEEKFIHRFSHFSERDDLHFFAYDALQPISGETKFDYIVHGASNAHPAAYVEQPVETMLSNFSGMKNLLDYAQRKGSRRMLYISSGEVYGRKDTPEPYREDDFGFVDVLNPRACYPSAKRATETLCSAYRKEYGIDFVIARPGHVYGPTCTENDTRASSQFARDVIAGKDIVMKSAGTQMRSYCYVIDCVTALLTILLRGEAGNAYNISNPDSVVSIRAVAEAFASAGGREVVFENASDVEKAGYNLMDNSSLDSAKLESLGWKGTFDLNTGVEHTLRCME